MCQQQSQNLGFLESKASAQGGEEGEGDMVLVSFLRQRLSYHTSYHFPTRLTQN